jgi:hypothetical protein
MNKKSYKFKPCRLFSLYYLLLPLKILFPLYVCACLYPQNFLLPTVIIVSSLVALYFVSRIFYRIKYIIDDEYLTAYQGKKIFFKIKKSDIVYVYVKKGHWYDILIFIFMTMFEQTLFVECCSSISFMFKDCEEIITIKRDGFERISLVPKEKSNFYEMPEYFSYNQSKKICKLLEIEPIIAKKYDHYKERTFYSDDL